MRSTRSLSFSSASTRSRWRSKSVIWGAPRPRNEKPGVVSRAGLGHTPEGYLFIHGSRFNVQKSQVVQKHRSHNLHHAKVVFGIPRNSGPHAEPGASRARSIRSRRMSGTPARAAEVGPCNARRELGRRTALRAPAEAPRMAQSLYARPPPRSRPQFGDCAV